MICVSSHELCSVTKICMNFEFFVALIPKKTHGVASVNINFRKILYQDSNSHFYSYNINNFYESVGPRGVNIKGPIWRPVRLIMNLILTLFLLVVPVFYGIIFR